MAALADARRAESNLSVLEEQGGELSAFLSCERRSDDQGLER